MGRPDHFDEKGIPVFTADSMFRPGENMYIHMSAQMSEYVGVPHKHAFLEIVYVISGSAIHETAGGSYTVSRGDVIVVNYDTPPCLLRAGKGRTVQCLRSDVYAGFSGYIVDPCP